MDCLRSPSRSKNACNVAALRPGRAPHDRAAVMVNDRGQVALATAVGDLVTADRHEPGQPRLVEMVGDDPRDDQADRVPADPQQAGDRCLGHLLRQPRDDVFEVARVRRARPRPRHGLVAHAAVGAAQPAQLALDDAAVGAEIEVAPALDAPAVNLERRADRSVAQTLRRRRSPTVTITPSAPKLTSVTDAPGRRSRRLVGSARGAVSALPPARFPGPPPEPDVRLSPHPALHDAHARQACPGRLGRGSTVSGSGFPGSGSE